MHYVTMIVEQLNFIVVADTAVAYSHKQQEMVDSVSNLTSVMNIIVANSC